MQMIKRRWWEKKNKDGRSLLSLFLYVFLLFQPPLSPILSSFLLGGFYSSLQKVEIVFHVHTQSFLLFDTLRHLECWPKERVVDAWFDWLIFLFSAIKFQHSVLLAIQFNVTDLSTFRFVWCHWNRWESLAALDQTKMAARISSWRVAPFSPHRP